LRSSISADRTADESAAENAAGHYPGQRLGPERCAGAVGLVISLATGLLLFAARAASVSANGTFQVKMLLLVAAAVFHFTVHRKVTQRPSGAAPLLRATGVVGLALWLGVAATGCAFILLE